MPSRWRASKRHKIECTMDKPIRQIAVCLAVLLFFLMAAAGWLSGHEPAVCTQRALVGAVVLYLATRVAGNLVMRILVQAMAQDRMRDHRTKTTHNNNEP